MISLNEAYWGDCEHETDILSFLSGGFNIYPEKGGLSIDYTVNKKDLSIDEQEALMDKAYEDTQDMRDEMGLGEEVNAFAFEIEEEDGFLIAKFFFEAPREDDDLSGEIFLADDEDDDEVLPG